VDEVFKSELIHQPHEDKVYRKLTQPTEDLILNRNAELRKNPGALRDLSFGRQLASIPFNLWEKAIRDGYDLNSPDKVTKEREMYRYLQSPEGRTCMVQENQLHRPGAKKTQEKT